MISDGVILTKDCKQAIVREPHCFKPITEDGRTIQDLILSIVPTRESGKYMTSVEITKELSEMGFTYKRGTIHGYLIKVHDGMFIERIAPGKYVLSHKGLQVYSLSAKNK